jgi:hypothetical protein
MALASIGKECGLGFDGLRKTFKKISFAADLLSLRLRDLCFIIIFKGAQKNCPDM